MTRNGDAGCAARAHMRRCRRGVSISRRGGWGWIARSRRCAATFLRRPPGRASRCSCSTASLRSASRSRARCRFGHDTGSFRRKRRYSLQCTSTCLTPYCSCRGCDSRWRWRTGPARRAARPRARAAPAASPRRDTAAASSRRPLPQETSWCLLYEDVPVLLSIAGHLPPRSASRCRPRAAVRSWPRSPNQCRRRTPALQSHPRCSPCSAGCMDNARSSSSALRVELERSASCLPCTAAATGASERVAACRPAVLQPPTAPTAAGAP